MRKEKAIETLDLSNLQEKKIGVAVSGGVDSMVLLDLLNKKRLSLVVLHCNFHLRGAESDEETKLVHDYCQKNKIDFFVKHFYKGEVDSNTQIWAREKRYDWFLEKEKSEQLDVIVVAHHREDSSETALINFLRGTGIKGITGIHSGFNSIERPLLSISKEEVVNYAKVNDVPFRNDSSNEESNYLRNYLRNEFIPTVESMLPGVNKRMAASVSNINKAYQFWNLAYTKWLENKRSSSPFLIDDKDIQEDAQNGFISTYLLECGFSSGQLQDMSNTQRVGACLEAQNLILERRVEGWLLYDNEANDLDVISLDIDQLLSDSSGVELGGGSVLHVELHPINEKKIFDRTSLYVSKAKLNGRLQLRKWKNGDVFVPFGMKGEKKLSDYFIDNKFSKKKKVDQWLLCDQKNIIWIVGERGDNRYRIHEDESEILKFYVINDL